MAAVARRIRTIAAGVLALAVWLLVTLAPAGGPSRPAAASAGASLAFPIAACSASSTATVNFSWTPVPGASQQWLDLTLLDNGFQPTTFVSVGPLPPASSTFGWSGIVQGLPHLWRVNALTPGGWITSSTGAFVPCGAGPALLSTATTCAGTTEATIDLRWAPMASPHSVQWIDLGSDPGFAPGTFAGAGPLSAFDQSFRWAGIQANAGYVFRVNELAPDGTWHASAVGNLSANCAPSVRPDLYGSDDRLVVPKLGINAPVNVRDVGADGVMGNPAGPTDVVRYNFPLFPDLGGYPGSGGTTILAGHVDYRGYGPAVFAQIRALQAGDIIEYYRADGIKVTYQVDWSESLYTEADWASLARATDPESIVLITCEGTFDPATRSYDQRRVVHGVRVS